VAPFVTVASRGAVGAAFVFDEIVAGLCGYVHVRPLWVGGCALVVTVHSWCCCVFWRVVWWVKGASPMAGARVRTPHRGG